MDSPGEILRLCRLCLVKDQVNIPIFEEEGDSREIFLKISSCLPVKVSREDRLPKKICDGCSEKLNSFYEFWSSSANAEKTLLSWVGEEDVEEKTEPAVSKSLAASATLVKEESEPVDEAHAESIEESTKDEADEAPPAKRARRSAAVKAQINLAPDSEDDDLDMGEPLTKTEEESAESDGEDKDPSYTDMPGTSADDEQAGPSGMGKDGVEAPNRRRLRSRVKVTKLRDKMPPKLHQCTQCFVHFSKRSEFEAHLSTHNEVLFKTCKYCKQRFTDLEFLAQHEKEVHGSRNTYKCKFCLNSFSQKYILMKHYRVHSEQEVYLCNHCNDVFLRLDDLHMHKATQHIGKKLYKCEHCNKEFSHYSFLMNHISMKHKPLD